MVYAPGILITHCSRKDVGNVTGDCCLRASMAALISNALPTVVALCHLLDVSIVRRGFRQTQLPSRLNNSPSLSPSTFSFLHLSCAFQSLPFTIDTTPPSYTQYLDRQSYILKRDQLLLFLLRPQPRIYLGRRSNATIPSQVVLPTGEGKLGKRKLSNADSEQPPKKTMTVSC
jgi:hypothetical protein